MKNFFFTLICALSTCPLALAQPAETKPVVPQTTTEKAAPKKPLADKTVSSETAVEPTIPEKVVETVEEKTEKIAEASERSREYRGASAWSVHAGYSYLDLVLIGKYSLAVAHQVSADETWEYEYLKGSLAAPGFLKNLGSMNEERHSISKRSYAGSNSFNFSYGLMYNRFSLSLGDELLNRMSGGYTPSSELARVESLGVILGIGNRWVFKKHYSIGVDWISWGQPLITMRKEANFLTQTNNVSDRDDVGTVLNVVNYFPRLAALKVQFGFLF